MHARNHRPSAFFSVRVPFCFPSLCFSQSRLIFPLSLAKEKNSSHWRGLAAWAFFHAASLVSIPMSARQSEDGLGLLGGMLPDPAVLERMLSAAGLRVNGAAGTAAATAAIAAAGNLNEPQNQYAAATATTSFAAALESIVREEQEATAAAEAATADAALLRAASEQQRRAASGAAAAAPPQAPLLKVCRLCRVEQPLDSFYRVSTSRDGRDARCRACDARKCAERRKRRREERHEGGPDSDSEGEGGAPTEKLCRKCGVLKPADSFYRNRASGDGLCDACKPCFNAAAGARRDEKVRRRREEAEAATATAGKKQCRRCALPLPSGAFHRNSAAVDGLASCCKRCHAEATRERGRARERAERRGSEGGAGPPARPQRRRPTPAPAPPPPDGAKGCRRCGLRKPRSEFHASRAAADGLQGYCRACFTENAAERRRRNAVVRGKAAERLAEMTAEERGEQRGRDVPLAPPPLLPPPPPACRSISM